MPSYRIAHGSPYEGDIDEKFQGWSARLTPELLAADLGDEVLARKFLKENPKLLNDRYWAKVRNFDRWDGDGIQFNVLGHIIRAKKVATVDGKADFDPTTSYFTPTVFMKNGSTELVAYTMGSTTGLPAVRARITGRLYPGRERGILHALKFQHSELKALADQDKLGTHDYTELGAPEAGSGNRVSVKGHLVSESPHVQTFPRNARSLLNYPSAFLTKRGDPDPTYVRIAENGSIYSFNAQPKDLHTWAQQVLLPIVRKHRNGKLTLPDDDVDEETDE